MFHSRVLSTKALLPSFNFNIREIKIEDDVIHEFAENLIFLFLLKNNTTKGYNNYKTNNRNKRSVICLVGSFMVRPYNDTVGWVSGAVHTDGARLIVVWSGPGRRPNPMQVIRKKKGFPFAGQAWAFS